MTLPVFIVFCLWLLVEVRGDKNDNLAKANPMRHTVKVGDERIIGGKEAKPNQFPYQVAVTFDFMDRRAFCGGSLLSKRYVMTAGHCAQGVKNVEVILGAHNRTNTLEPGRQSFAVDESDIIIHPQYENILHENDIALMRLPNDADFTESVQPVQLPSWSQAAKNMTFEYYLATVSGWGVTSENMTVSVDVLRYVELDVITNEQCKKNFLLLVSEDTVCTGAEGVVNACNGDSGGPLVINESFKPTQIGIVSKGHTNCKACYPTVYTRVSSYLKFIADNSDVRIRD